MQLEIDFEAGITSHYPRFIDVVRSAAYRSPRQMKAIAADLDKSQSELSRLLADNPNDPRHFPTELLSDYINATGKAGIDIIHWLIEKHMDDPGRQREERINLALSVLEKVPEALEVLKELKAEK